MLLLLAAVAPALAECPDDALSVALDSASKLELAYASLDDAGFDAAHLRLKDAIPCIHEELTPSDAAALHRARALGAFVGGDEASSRRSWAAVHALQPDWQPSLSLMPQGHPMRTLWTDASGAPPATPQALDMAPRGGWSIDGVRTAQVPTDRAYLLQGLGADGAVIYTGYGYTPADVPHLDDMVPAGKVVTPATHRGRTGVHTVGSVAAAVLAGGAGVTLGMGAQARGDLFDGDTDVGQVAPLQQKANTMTGVGAGLGVAAIGAGVVTWAVPW